MQCRFADRGPGYDLQHPGHHLGAVVVGLGIVRHVSFGVGYEDYAAPLSGRLQTGVVVRAAVAHRLFAVVQAVSSAAENSGSLRWTIAGQSRGGNEAEAATASARSTSASATAPATSPPGQSAIELLIKQTGTGRPTAGSSS